jgi:hypothetical protein
MDCYGIVGENRLAEPGSTEASLRSALSSQAGAFRVAGRRIQGAQPQEQKWPSYQANEQLQR